MSNIWMENGCIYSKAKMMIKKSYNKNVNKEN